jgi:hypothetical protein
MVMDDRVVIVEEAAEGSYLARPLMNLFLLQQTMLRHYAGTGGRWGSSTSAVGTLVIILVDASALYRPQRNAALEVVRLQHSNTRSSNCFLH